MDKYRHISMGFKDLNSKYFNITGNSEQPDKACVCNKDGGLLMYVDIDEFINILIKFKDINESLVEVSTIEQKN